MNASEITYYLFTKDNVNNYVQLDTSNIEKLSTTKPVVFLIHGWTENRRRQWYSDLKNAILENNDVNVIQVDYSRPAAENYFAAVYLASQVG